MTVASILRSKGNSVYTIEGGRMLADAAAILNDRHIGAIVVVDAPGEVAGILGEREIVAAIARHGAQVLTHPVRDHMVRNAATCRRSDSVGRLMALMTETRLRHIPVVEDGKLVGVVSIGDIVKQRIAETEREAETLREYITAH
jgi:CBS domain-containing protein